MRNQGWLLGLAIICVFGSGCAEPVPLANQSSEPSSAASAASTEVASAESQPASGSQPAPPSSGDSGGGVSGPSTATEGPSPSVPGSGASGPSSGSDPFGAEGTGTRGADPFEGASPPPSTTPPANTERVKADVGVGKKGRSLDKYNSGVQQIVAEPAKSLFAVRERLTFEVSIPHALQLYEATTGYAPRSHDEFMREVIQANNIQLPELRPNQRYVWDPQRKELMVERPISP